MRLFVAIGLPDGVRHEIGSTIDALRSPGAPVSWVPEGNLHVTLKFLGEVDPERVEAVGAALDSAVSPFEIFPLDAEGGGAFPSTRAPRVLWVGFREPLELARALQDNIESALSAAGFPREPKPFHPHVTIGRLRNVPRKGWCDATVNGLAGRRFGIVPVASVLLYESRLSPSGATYRVIGRHPFSGGAASTEPS